MKNGNLAQPTKRPTPKCPTNKTPNLKMSNGAKILNSSNYKLKMGVGTDFF